MAAKKQRKRVLGQGVEALLGKIDTKVKERKKIPYQASSTFLEDQETLALSRHELLSDRNKIKDELGKTQAANRALHRKIAEMKEAAEILPPRIPVVPEEFSKPPFVASEKPIEKVMTEEVFDLPKSKSELNEGVTSTPYPKVTPLVKPQFDTETYKVSEPAPMVDWATAHGSVKVPKELADELLDRRAIKSTHTKERIEIPVVKTVTVETPAKFDWFFEIACMILVIGGVMIGIAISHTKLLRETRDALLQMQTDESCYSGQRQYDPQSQRVVQRQAQEPGTTTH